MVAQNLVYESLVDSTEEGIVPCLATSWEISDDGTVYTFHLRKGVKFHDDADFNAHVAKMNIDAVQGNKNQFSWLQLSNVIDHVDVVDEYTINLILSKAYYPALAELSLCRPYTMLSPNDFIDGETQKGVKGYNGTGPYVLTDHVVDEHATFKSFKDYWGGEPKVKTFVWRVLPAGQTTYLAMLNGEINFSFPSSSDGDLLDEETMANLKKSADFTIYRSNPVSTRMLDVNTVDGSAALTNSDVRNAIWYAIDRDSLANGVMSGNEYAAYTLFSSKTPYCNVKLEDKEMNVKKANELLDNAGWRNKSGAEYRSKDGVTLELGLIYNGSSAKNKSICEVIKSNLKSVGIKINLNGVGSTAHNTYRKSGGYDLILDQSWGAPYDPATTLGALTKGSSYGKCLGGLSSADKVWQNILDMMSSTKEDVRQNFYTDILTELHDEAILIPLTYSSVVLAASNNIKNILFNYSQYDIPVHIFSWKRLNNNSN